jgi:hypothetical protein
MVARMRCRLSLASRGGIATGASYSVRALFEEAVGAPAVAKVVVLPGFCTGGCAVGDGFAVDEDLDGADAVAADVRGGDARVTAQHRDDRVVDVLLGDGLSMHGEQHVDVFTCLAVQSFRLAGPQCLPGLDGLPTIGSTGLVNAVPVLCTGTSSRQTASSARVSRSGRWSRVGGKQGSHQGSPRVARVRPPPRRRALGPARRRARIQPAQAHRGTRDGLTYSLRVPPDPLTETASDNPTRSTTGTSWRHGQTWPSRHSAPDRNVVSRRRWPI